MTTDPNPSQSAKIIWNSYQSKKTSASDLRKIINDFVSFLVSDPQITEGGKVFIKKLLVFMYLLARMDNDKEFETLLDKICTKECRSF